jgi:hypothetical protein
MKVFYIVACVLLVLAIACEVLAINAAAHGSQMLAAAAARDRQVDDKARNEASRYAHISDSFSSASAILAFLGFASWVYSYARGYRWRPVIPVVPLIIYMAVFFVAV